jgi:hypothetical protein
LSSSRWPGEDARRSNDKRLSTSQTQCVSTAFGWRLTALEMTRIGYVAQPAVGPLLSDYLVAFTQSWLKAFTSSAAMAGASRVSMLRRSSM